MENIYKMIKNKAKKEEKKLKISLINKNKIIKKKKKKKLMKKKLKKRKWKKVNWQIIVNMMKITITT